MSRADRVSEAIRKEVSLIIHDELKDPRLGFVTVTGVEMSADLRHAKIIFSVLGKDEDYKNTQKALDSALGFIRKLIAERINLRFAPEIIFREDRSSEYSVRIQEVLDQIKEQDETCPSAHAAGKTKKRKDRRRSEPKKSSRKHKKK